MTIRMNDLIRLMDQKRQAIKQREDELCCAVATVESCQKKLVELNSEFDSLTEQFSIELQKD